MKNWGAFKTHHKNQTRGMLRLRRVLKEIGKGMQRGDSASGDTVFQCAACKGPVVDSKQARARHARKNEQCRAAMGL